MRVPRVERTGSTLRLGKAPCDTVRLQPLRHPARDETMTERMPHIVAVGEVMIELARGSDGRYGLAFGGDTFNTVVYLARAGVEAAYATALGDDPYSAGIVALATAEGVATDLV